MPHRAHDGRKKSEEARARAIEQEILLDQNAARDPFTSAFLRTMGADVVASLDDTQRRSLDKALRACRPFQHHAVDLRATVSLVFVRFYVVFLAGRDRRKKTKGVEHDRRARVSRMVDLAASLVVALFVAVVLLSVLALVLYLLKSALGIDLVPGKHVWELFGMARAPRVAP
jgi:hypothetical protein